MTKNKENTIRMSNPEDKFNKRQFEFLGEAFHKNHNLPGEYIRTIPTEKIKSNGEKREADIAYIVIMPDASFQIINVEDESSRVKTEELRKAYDYKTLFICRHWMPVMTVITTTQPYEKCLKEFKYSQTESLTPHIISLPYDGAWNDLNNMIYRIKKQELFTKSEGLKFISLPRCCKHNQSEAVERICEVLLDMKVENLFTLIELANCMQCMIHKYAKTDEDILRLQEMIGLKELKIKKMTILDEVEARGKAKGEAKGILKGKIEIITELLNDPKNNYTAEELSEKFGINIEQIQKGK